MSTRRIRALEALAERGATEGEREAARRALEKHRGEPLRLGDLHCKGAYVKREHGGMWSVYIYTR